MFLNILNQEEKLNFMGFVYLVANCDGEYAEEEEELVNNYMIELGLNTLPKIEKSIEEIIEYFSLRDKSVKKVVLFEIYGLMLSDENISDEENEIINKINNIFNLEEFEVEEIKGLVVRLQNVYDDIYNTLF